MGKQNNFKEAVSELMNGKFTTDPEPEDLQDTKSKDLQKNSSFFVSSAKSESIYKSSAISVIAEDLVIEGSVYGESTIQINGKVKGNVTSTMDIIVKGTIEGDIKGSNISLSHSRIKGNVNALNNLTVDSESVIVGNITAGSVEINGKIKGDIRVGNMATLKKSTVILGNLTARAVSIESGAGIKGRLEVLAENINDKEFKIENVKSDSVSNEANADPGTDTPNDKIV